MKRVLIWDIPIRLYHWLLAAGFLGAFAIAEFADDDGPAFVIHMLLGLGVGLLAVLRIVWGFLGSRYARFSSFEFRPRFLLAYLKGLLAPAGETTAGHNPATSYTVIGMLAACLGLAISGSVMGFGGGEGLEEVHELCVAAMLGLAAVHVAGVVLHTLRYRDGLALSMFDGKKKVASDSAIMSEHLVAGLVGLGLIVLAQTWLFAGYDPTTGRVAIVGTGLTLGGESEEESDDREQGKRDQDEPKHKARKHGERKKDHAEHDHGDAAEDKGDD